MTRTRYILLHDLWQSQRHWSSVRRHLKSAGHAVHVLQLPGRGALRLSRGGVGAEINAILMAVESLGKPVALVAHGWSGAVASAAAAKLPERVSHVIHVASVLPEDGPRSLFDQLPQHYREIIDSCIDHNGFVAPPPLPIWREAFAPDMPQTHAAGWHATLTPVPWASVDTRIDLTGFYTLVDAGSIATTYVHLRGDNAYGAANRWVEYAQCLSRRSEITIPGGHEAHLTWPAALAAALRFAASRQVEPASPSSRLAPASADLVS